MDNWINREPQQTGEDEFEKGGNKKIADPKYVKVLKGVFLSLILGFTLQQGAKFITDEYIEVNGYKLTKNNCMSLYNPNENDFVILTKLNPNTGYGTDAIDNKTVDLSKFYDGYQDVDLFDMVESGKVKSEKIGINKYRVKSDDLSMMAKVEHIKQLNEQALNAPSTYQIKLVVTNDEGISKPIMLNADEYTPLYNQDTGDLIIVGKEENVSKTIDVLTGKSIALKDYINYDYLDIYALTDQQQISSELSSSGDQVISIHEESLINSVKKYYPPKGLVSQEEHKQEEHDYKIRLFTRDKEGKIDSFILNPEENTPLYNEATGRFVVIAPMKDGNGFVDLLTGESLKIRDYVGSKNVDIYALVNIDKAQLSSTIDLDANAVGNAVINMYKNAEKQPII